MGGGLQKRAFFCRVNLIDSGVGFGIIFLADTADNKRATPKKGGKNMKQRTKKLLLIIPTVVILVLGGVLVAITAASRSEDDLPTLSDGVETPPEDTAEETPPETEPEPEPELPDLSSKGLTYERLGNGTCLVSGLGICTDSEILLPTVSPDGDLVVGIGDDAFRGKTGVKGITLTPAITTIGEYAFYGSGLLSINIPAETTHIGEYAFCGCYSLTKISVSEENLNYSDVSGVLFNKSETEIICYPAGRVENFYTISSKVEKIRTMAFYNCNAIKLVNYVGSGSNFRTIQVGAGNEVIERAIIIYSESSDLFDVQDPEGK